MKSIEPGELVLVTGGTGSLGYELTKSLLQDGARVRILSRDEKKQYDMAKLFPQCQFRLGDVRDKAAVRDAVRDVDVIIHGASLKYVNISELQPSEYVTTNVLGSLNLIEAVLDEKHVRRCVGISTDKACLPVNTYGLTKALLEKVFLEAADRQGDEGGTIFNVARYGNVVGTRGSVVPFWQECREAGRPLPITNPDMTRFFFTLEEAVDLIDFTLRQPGKIITSKRMNSCTLGQLAEVMKGPEGVTVVGDRPGEKHHEMLLSDDEMGRSTDEGDYFVFDPGAPPATREGFGSYNAPRLTNEEIGVLVNAWL